MRRGMILCGVVVFVSGAYLLAGEKPLKYSDLEKTGKLKIGQIDADDLKGAKSKKSKKAKKHRVDLKADVKQVQKLAKKGARIKARGKTGQADLFNSENERNKKLAAGKEQLLQAPSAAPMTVFNKPKFVRNGGGVAARIPSVSLRNGRGGQFALTIEAFNKNTRALIARGPFLRINSDHALAHYRNVNLTLSRAQMKGFSGPVTFSIVSYFSPNRRSGWRMSNYMPFGHGNADGGNVTSLFNYSAAFLTGRSFKYENIGFGVAIILTYTFLYDSSQDCLEYKYTSVGASGTSSTAGSTTGCAYVRGNRLVLQSRRFCDKFDRCSRSNSRKTENIKIFSNAIKVGRNTFFTQ